jgi:hypothetical protein
VDISDVSNKDILLLTGRGGQGGLTTRQEVGSVAMICKSAQSSMKD